MAKLYPPNIEGTIPAFYTEGGTTMLVVPFSMNRAVGKSEVYGFSLKLKYVDGSIIDTYQVFNSNVIISNSDTYNISEGSFYDLEKSLEVSFNVDSSLFNIGQYYKIQLAYIDENNQIGYYSTIGVIKYTCKPIVEIAGLTGEINAHTYEYVGVYSQYQKDPTEKVYSSRFLLTDANGIVIKDTGYMLHNTTEDELPYESREGFKWAKDLNPNLVYYITYQVKTMNGLECSSNRYRICQLRLAGNQIDIKLNATLDYENGYIGLSFICDEPIISGTFLISRACSKDNYQWNELKRFDVQSLIPKEWSLKDCTIEQGYTYQYSLQQYNAYDIYSERVLSQEVFADFEHAFLYDGIRQFKIKFDPKITNFKNNILENKIDTIGNKYPFILRNGNINYKSFDIQGLISLHSDYDGLFISRDKYKLDDFEFTTNLTSNNIASERYFKRQVQDWLNDGNPKLFRSPTEGNFIVRILNVNLTPEDRLGRMIHIFKATAYEIEEFSIENLEKYNIIDSRENLSTLTRLSTVNLIEFSKQHSNINRWISVNSSRKCYSIKIQDCMPGTIFRIDGNEIMIGATGAYMVKSENGFSSVEIKPSDFQDNPYSFPILTYSYQTKAISVFGVISDINIIDVPIQQWIGKKERLNILDNIKDIRTTISSLELIRFKKKDIGQVYVDCSKPHLFDINVQYKYYIDENLTEEIKLDSLSKINLYQIRCKRSDYRDYYQEGYYIDNQNEIFAPFTNYILDGNTKQIYPITDDLFTIILNNDSEIDLTEIEKFEVQDVNAISSIIINLGIIAEIGYSKQISSYYFEDDNNAAKSLKNMLQSYENSIVKFKNAFVSSSAIGKIGQMTDYEIDNYSGTLNNLAIEIKEKYSAILSVLNSAIIEYKEHNGLQ